MNPPTPDSGSPPSPTAIVDPAVLKARLSAEQAVKRFRDVLGKARAALKQRFWADQPVTALVHAHATAVDEILVAAWCQFNLHLDTRSALIAVGGYGRGELHPASDIDLLVVLEPDAPTYVEERVRGFVTFLWDIGLEVGHSVRTVGECVELASRDVAVATNLMEARRLAGSQTLFEQVRERTGSGIWSSAGFFEAKLAEQQHRHHRFDDTAHNLEPNIKDGPGGLRDIQMVGWVAKHHFGASSLHELVVHGFLTETEYGSLIQGQSFLWRIRFALHLLTARREERLLFDHQRALATLFGYRDEEHSLAVERFMKPYYRTIMELSRLNEMLLSLFQEAILYQDDEENLVPINNRFRARKGFLEVTHDDVFARDPVTILELFLILQQHPNLLGVRASTIRLIRAQRHLIDESFRNDPRASGLFMDIIRQPRGITHELRRMHRYGLLGLYLPVFGAIEGQMQYDLFHAYTVDEHTLFVVGNLRGFAIPERAAEFPLCSDILRRLPKPELLYLGGLFHDIAKGRSGDHSELGANDATRFCLQHAMSEYDARFVSWLVKNHLLMSVTAQRRDISDPQVINVFASEVGDQTHLDYLYLLTVADIRATNPNLWNDWKDTLLKDLYQATEYALARGLENPVDKRELIDENQKEARRLLGTRGVDEQALERIWANLGDNYFLRADPEEVAWHTQAILAATRRQLPLILMRQGHGGTEVFVYTHDQHRLFAAIASTLDRLGLTILDARIITTVNNMTLDSFVILEADGVSTTSPEREREIKTALARQLRDPKTALGQGRRRARRQLRHFSMAPQVHFFHDESNARTMMEVVTSDRPGLLSRIGTALVDSNVSLQNAKIATFGERVEDMFYITDTNGKPLTEDACEGLKERVLEVLA